MKYKTTLKLQLCNDGDNMLHQINFRVMINVPRWAWDINNGAFRIKTETIKLMSTGVIRQHIISEPL